MNASISNAKEIFLELIGQYPPEQWDERLAQACGNDDDLLRRVQALLSAHREPNSFLEAPASGIVVESAFKTVTQTLPERPGTEIGPYKLLQVIGEGGMGVVYMAEQQEPVERRVALKIIKPGMDSRQVIARFDAERQALSLMDHPNIAKVLDAGATESGRPFFVMELVKGIPITQYCDDQHLSLRQRLELFVPVCQAVQHAHQKGIIHRDLKPSNVLVAEYDQQAVPKIIDFGLAKATAQKLTEKTMFTEFGQVVGTLEYMSPEQAKLNQLDIDTRTDVYSLGVLLYELLAGSTPFDARRLRRAAFDEMLRIIREEEPERPSTKLDSSETLASIAANRHTEPARLRKAVRGELDWIVMKALEKDRSRRYETASGFAADVKRFLNDEPVQACPPSRWYRVRKFAQRNRSVLAIATTVAVAVLVAVGSLGWMVRDQSARQAKLNHSVELALHDASTVRERALRLTGNRSEWQALLAAAMGALQRAEEISAQDVAALHPQLRKQVQSLRAQLDADATDQRFVAGIDNVLVDVIVWDARRSQFKNEEAFHTLKDSFQSDYGLKFGATPAAEAAHFLQQRPQPIQLHLLVALHVCLARVPQDDPQGKQWLADVLHVADGDSWRKQAREALTSSDWPTLEKLLKQLAVKQQPPALVLLLSSYLPGDAWSTKHDLVIQIQQSYPGEPGVSPFANALTCDILAWTFADGDLGSAKRAVELSKQAVRLAPKDGDFWNTLGVAHYRAGNWQESVAALKRASELSNDGDAVDWLFLAMAHKQLGQKDEARRWYDQALRRPATSKLLEAELPRFQVEAAKLLEIEH